MTYTSLSIEVGFSRPKEREAGLAGAGQSTGGGVGQVVGIRRCHPSQTKKKGVVVEFNAQRKSHPEVNHEAPSIQTSIASLPTPDI